MFEKCYCLVNLYYNKAFSPRHCDSNASLPFKVANFSVAEEKEDIMAKPSETGDTAAKTSWDEIIPEAERKRLQEEDEQKRELDLYLPPRHRNTVKKVSV